MILVRTVDVIRVVKAMQTGTLRDEAALRALAASVERKNDPELLAEVHDAIVTATNHCQALEHLIVRLDGGLTPVPMPRPEDEGA